MDNWEEEGRGRNGVKLAAKGRSRGGVELVAAGRQ